MLSASSPLSEALHVHGAEIFGWLVAVNGRAAALEIHSAFLERAARGIAGFRGESSMRTWLYQIARNEARRFRRDSLRARALFTPLEVHTSALERPEAAPSSFESRARRVELLRARLAPEDRELLVLRVDKGLSYREIASIFLETNDTAACEREEARLRKRFQDLREKLRAWARETV